MDFPPPNYIIMRHELLCTAACCRRITLNQKEMKMTQKGKIIIAPPNQQ